VARHHRGRGMKDYSVQLKVRNNRLLTRMRAAGYETAAELARASGENSPAVARVLSLKETGMSSRETWRPVVLRLSKFLRCLPEDIIPEQHRLAALSKNVAEVELDVEQVKALIDAGNRPMLADDNLAHREAVEQINRALETLTPREERAIRLRLLSDDPGVTYEQLGEELGVCKERARYLEGKALRKLAQASRTKLFALREILEDGDVS
jgi:RNA polymerase sigma factor (sigma-70 family)